MKKEKKNNRNGRGINGRRKRRKKIENRIRTGKDMKETML
jgi:hypothetical protein